MTVQELIDELLKIEDKSKQIKNTNSVTMNVIEEIKDYIFIKN